MTDGGEELSRGRLSTDTNVDLNTDIAPASEYSESAQKKLAGSVFSSMRSSMDGSPSILNAFNILKQGNAIDDDISASSSFPLGPNSIFELTIGSDAARLKTNRGLKNQVTINGGTTTIHHLIKPSVDEIPRILLHSLKKKVTNTELSDALVKDTISDYKSFELGYKALTEDMLSKFSEQQDTQKDDASGSISFMSDNDDDLIPQVFEDPNFRLDDPRIFRQVIENTRLLPDPDAPDEANSNIINGPQIQEKLSHYLDVVEVQLIHEISKTSNSFFSTLGDIQDIEQESKSCIDKFAEIKHKVADIEEYQAETGAKILDLIDERKSVNHLESSVLQLQSVLSKYADAMIHHRHKQHLKCLQEILVIENLILGVEPEDYQDEGTKHLYPKFEYPMVNLSRLPALEKFRQDVENLKLASNQGYSEEFVQLLVEDLRSHYKSISSKDTMNRIYVSIDRSRKYQDKNVNKTFNEIDSQTKKKIQNFIQNLSNSGYITTAFTEYQNSVIGEVKAIIRHNLPSGKPDPQTDELSSKDKSPSFAESEKTQTEGTPSGNASLSENIRKMSHDQFSRMMTAIYSNLSECLRRLTIHQKLLLDMSLSSLPPQLSQNIDVMSLDITNSINKAIELTQVRLVKILNVRLEQIGDLPVKQYLHLYLLSSAYLLECESINPVFVASGLGSSLTEWVRNHVGYFVHKFHSNSVRQVANACDKETWRECTTPEKISMGQDVLDTILGYSEYIKSDGQSGFSGSDWIEFLDFFEDDSISKETSKTANDSNSSLMLKIQDLEFLVPELILTVNEHVRDYLIIIKIFPSRAGSVSGNMLTFFKLLNTRVSLAILNAGATRTAGLKHITTKHLALCIQTIAFTIALLSAIQPVFANHRHETELNNSNSEEITIESVTNLYKSHRRELYDKLVSIMHDRTLNHCGAIMKLDLSQPIKHPQQSHPYMETLVKETTTVSKVLTKYLPETEYSYILLQIFSNYKQLLVKCYCMDLPQFKDFYEKQSILKDVDYFRVKLSDLPGYGNSGQVIWENVNSLPTIEDAKMEEVMRMNIANEKAIASSKTSMEETRSTPQSSEPRKSSDSQQVAETVILGLKNKEASEESEKESTQSVVLEESASKKQSEAAVEKPVEANSGQTKHEHSSMEDSKPEEPNAGKSEFEGPKVEARKVEDQTSEAPITEAPKEEDSKAADAKTEDVKTEDVRKEDVKIEDVKTEVAKTEEAETEDSEGPQSAPNDEESKEAELETKS